MMTGNMVSLASALGDWRLADAVRMSSLLVCFTFGCILYRTLVLVHGKAYYTQPQLHDNYRRPDAAARAGVLPLILALFSSSDVLFSYAAFFTSETSRKLAALPLALGFGLVNCAAMDAMGGTVTYAMTGHVQKVCQQVADWLFSTDPTKRQWQSVVQLVSTRIVGYFLMGAIFAAALINVGREVEFLSMDTHLPVFTILGSLIVGFLHFYDNPAPNVRQILTALFGCVTGRTAMKSKEVDISVNRWPQW